MNYEWLKEDLVQQGFVGLIEAYEKYDSSKNNSQFWSYASKFVKGRMIDFTIQYCNPIRFGKKINSLMLQIKKEDLIDNSPEYIANYLKCTVTMATEALYLLSM